VPATTGTHHSEPNRYRFHLEEEMVDVKVLGPGCRNCLRLEERVRRAAGDREDVVIEKITDVAAMLSYGVMATPALVVDRAVVSAGRLPSEQEIAGWLR